MKRRPNKPYRECATVFLSFTKLSPAEQRAAIYGTVLFLIHGEINLNKNAIKSRLEPFIGVDLREIQFSGIPGRTEACMKLKNRFINLVSNLISSRELRSLHSSNNFLLLKF